MKTRSGEVHPTDGSPSFGWAMGGSELDEDAYVFGSHEDEVRQFMQQGLTFDEALHRVRERD